MKAKTIVSLVFGLEFVHSHGLLHSHLTKHNVFLNEVGVIEMRDIYDKDLSDIGRSSAVNGAVEGFSKEDWTPKADIQAFARILSEIVVGVSDEESGRDGQVASFVSDLIK
jgi:hypothetical protein